MARPKKIKADEPIKLWFKKVANGNKSIIWNSTRAKT